MSTCHHRRLTVMLAAWLIATLALSSHAAVFERDWQTTGDGLLTFDDVNNREWLDVPVSLLSQYDPPFVVDAVEIAFQSALSDLELGGRFEGFTVAKRDDVLALAESGGGIDTTTSDFDTNQMASMALIDLLGATYEPTASDRFTIGLIDEVCMEPFCGPPPNRFAALFEVTLGNRLSPASFRAGLRLSHNDDFIGSNWSGVMLFRTVVPEPSAGFLAILAAGLSLITRTRRQ